MHWSISITYISNGKDLNEKWIWNRVDGWIECKSIFLSYYQSNNFENQIEIFWQILWNTNVIWSSFTILRYSLDVINFYGSKKNRKKTWWTWNYAHINFLIDFTPNIHKSECDLRQRAAEYAPDMFIGIVLSRHVEWIGFPFPLCKPNFFQVNYSNIASFFSWK